MGDSSKKFKIRNWRLGDSYTMRIVVYVPRNETNRIKQKYRNKRSWKFTNRRNPRSLNDRRRYTVIRVCKSADNQMVVNFNPYNNRPSTSFGPQVFEWWPCSQRYTWRAFTFSVKHVVSTEITKHRDNVEFQKEKARAFLFVFYTYIITGRIRRNKKHI